MSRCFPVQPTLKKHFAVLPLIAALVFLAACQKNAEPPLFEKLAPTATGISFENRLVEEPLFNSVNYLYFYDGGGVAVGDINNDGLPDLYFTANQQPNRLYLNRGDMHFEDITEKAGVGGGSGGWTTGVTMADVNGDGWLDLYVCRTTILDRKGANQLFINNGDTTFTEQAADYGLDFTGLSRQAAFFDYDLDGDLDMYLLNHSVHSKKTYQRAHLLRETRDPEAGDRLYENRGGRFVDVSEQAGIYGSALGYGLGVAVGDINWDGYPDIYISNDFHEDDYLYYNNGDGTFTEAMRRSMQHISSASMGNDIADFNNDGLLDIVVLDMLPEDEKIRKASVMADPYDIYETKLEFGYYHQLRRNTLQLNRGPDIRPNSAAQKPRLHLFSDIGQLAGIHATDWSWAPLFADFDNDGYKDLFVSNGIYRRPNDLDYLAYIKSIEDELESGGRAGAKAVTAIPQNRLDEIVAKMPIAPVANYAFRGRGDLTFENRAAEWGLGEPGFSSGAAYADLDNDGDLDLVVNNTNAPASVYRNRLNDGRDRGRESTNGNIAPEGPHYLKIRLNGAGRNPFGVGAKVILHAQGRLFYQELMPTRGFQSSVEPVLLFGLGAVTRIDSLVVVWPGSGPRMLRGVATDQVLALAPVDGLPLPDYLPFRISEPFLQDVSREIAVPFVHEENTFIEFNREPFIPHFISHEGPAMAVADVDGDGLDDLYLGGGKLQAGAIYLQKNGAFTAPYNPDFTRDRQSEDVEAAFFDANGDGRPDLYVVSGGNEWFGKQKPQLDRLYLNRGDGRFEKAANALPALFANGACVAPADFDRDGDVDLFVGSRSIPRLYGMLPDSYLLVNDGQGRFSDLSDSLAPALSELGMVTDAVWADVDGDDWPDLVLTGEWMPVTVLENRQGRLVMATEKYGFGGTNGWWNAIVAADFNGDGRPDFVAGNQGLNNLFQAGAGHPVRLFINDFSGDGRPDQILTYFWSGKSYPLAAPELMMEKIPALRGKYPTMASFAGQPIEAIFPREQLRQAAVRQAFEFASMVFLSTEDGKYSAQKLPVEVQFSPVFALLVDDFDGDGALDILTGGNFFGVAPDQGRYDASYGSLLLGDGRGGFRAATLQESGFIVDGEIRELGIVKTAGGERLILAVRNNAGVVVFRQRPNSAQVQANAIMMR